MFRAKIKRTKKNYIKATKDGAIAAVLALVKQGEANSKRIVRKKSGQLARSIQSKSRKYKGEWYTEMPYAKAQEYGIPGTKYGFTPYMRTGAMAVKRAMSRMVKAIMKKFYTKMRETVG